MGIPQGSVIAPLLFNILLHDLPSKLSKHVNLVQFADDICFWMNVSMKKDTSKHLLNHIIKIYQNDLNSLNNYMSENGLTLSKEKSHMLLFNNGANPKSLPIFKLGNTVIEYVNKVKFMGVYFTPKMTWNCHFEHILTKARKSLNLLKIICKQSWGNDISVLLHLSLSLVRSKLTYGQEVFFSAPKYLLQKLQSIDCKAIKLSLGLPFHASNTKPIIYLVYYH